MAIEKKPERAEGEETSTQNFDLKLIEAKSRGYATFLDLAKVARDLITLYLVGVLDTTQSGAGSHGTSGIKKLSGASDRSNRIT